MRHAPASEGGGCVTAAGLARLERHYWRELFGASLLYRGGDDLGCGLTELVRVVLRIPDIREIGRGTKGCWCRRCDAARAGFDATN